MSVSSSTSSPGPLPPPLSNSVVDTRPRSIGTLHPNPTHRETSPPTPISPQSTSDMSASSTEWEREDNGGLGGSYQNIDMTQSTINLGAPRLSHTMTQSNTALFLNAPQYDTTAANTAPTNVQSHDNTISNTAMSSSYDSNMTAAAESADF